MCELNVLYQIFIDSIKNELAAKLTTDLSYLRIREFGYRQFLSNGTTVGFCTRNNSNNNKISNFHNKNLSYESLRRFYNQETSNSFVIYRRTTDKIEGFYFLSSSKDPEIIRYYLKHNESFEYFINLVSFYADLALGSIKFSKETHENLYGYPNHENSPNENLYVKVLSQNSVETLFLQRLANQQTIKIQT